MLATAGFVGVEVHEVPADPMDSVYVAHRPCWPSAVAPTHRRFAVVGCGRGELVIALEFAGPSDVVAGFDPDPTAIAAARRWAARLGVADRVTFEVAGPACLLGQAYDLVFLLAASDW